MNQVTRKLVFRGVRPGRTRPACSASEAGYRLENFDLASIDISLSKQRTTKALVRLRGCAGLSAPLLFAYDINRFSHDAAQILFWKPPVFLFVRKILDFRSH